MLFTLWKILKIFPLDNGIFPYGQDTFLEEPNTEYFVDCERLQKVFPFNFNFSLSSLADPKIEFFDASSTPESTSYHHLLQSVHHLFHVGFIISTRFSWQVRRIKLNLTSKCFPFQADSLQASSALSQNFWKIMNNLRLKFQTGCWF